MNSIRDNKKVIESNAITTCEVSIEQKTLPWSHFCQSQNHFPH